jgi:hypothetical protein
MKYARAVALAETPPPQLITYADAGRISRTSSAWWRRFAARGGINPVRLSRRCVRLKASDVQAVIDAASGGK